jgi:AraC family transcriptional regulator, regulatory protein of adaptative response / DNA-3-methyladenine glycosylase II
MRACHAYVRKWRAIAQSVSYGFVMSLDQDECYRAICARDPRYDGRFYICVHTTGIFCRPICPARTPLRKNVQFVETAEAAIQLGFRACKRCRPEVKAGSSAWDLTAASIKRALRMIDSGALDDQSVEQFAGKLGVGARHLRRLVKSALGVAPNRLALARRAAFARGLIEGSNLAMTEVAAASGFRSLRRFNDVVQTEFGATPTQLREKSNSSSAGGAMTLTLKAKGAADWPSLVQFYAARIIPGLESVREERYVRALRVGGALAVIAVEQGAGEALNVSVTGAKVGELYAITGRVRRALDLDTDVAAIAKALSVDKTLKPAMSRIRSLRLPGAWDPFELAVRAMLGQQISVKAARTLAGRIVSQFGEALPPSLQGHGPTQAFPTAATLAGVQAEDFMALGLTTSRAKALCGLANAVAADAAIFAPAGSLDALIQKLCALEGVGPWTAHYIALRAFGESDAFPASDLGLRKAYGALTGALPSAQELERAAAKWSPWRGYAAQALWNYLSELESKEKADGLAA